MIRLVKQFGFRKLQRLVIGEDRNMVSEYVCPVFMKSVHNSKQLLLTGGVPLPYWKRYP